MGAVAEEQAGYRLARPVYLDARLMIRFRFIRVAIPLSVRCDRHNRFVADDRAAPEGPQQLPAAVPSHQVPAWLRRTEGEVRLPVVVAIVGAIVLQAVLPDQLAIRPRWLLPALEGALLIGLTAFNPVRMNRAHPVARAASLALTVLMTGANAASAALLIRTILLGHGTENPTTLMGSGAAIYVTNVVAFALWYWECDRGGPVDRADALDPHPDFLFPQIATPGIAHPDWEPTFPDYLYVSFTNATAFSPTDTLPLARWAKLLMATQSIIALATVALVVARAVNVLGS